LILDIAFYSILTWYFDNVIPDEFGNRQPLWFFLLPSYWSSNRNGELNYVDWLRNVKNMSQYEDNMNNEDAEVKAEREKTLSEGNYLLFLF